MKKKLVHVGAAIILVVLLLVLILFVMFFQEIRTLSSVKTLNDKDMYQMTYYGNYYFDEFLASGGAQSEEEIKDFFEKKFTKGLPINLDDRNPACSTYMAHNTNGDVIFGRNFDFSYTPIVVVQTHPKGGYASVSVADLAFIGYTKDSIPKKDGISLKKIYMLMAPYFSEDGMNEKGVAISMMTVPDADNPYIEGAPYLTTTAIVRLVLDKAANVDEAIELIRGSNIYWWSNIKNHFMISDATGRSVVVEYKNKELVIIEQDTDYQISTNYNFYDGLRRGSGQDRYDTIEKTLLEKNGVLNEADALEVLKKVGIPGRIQWSALYNLTTGDVCVFPRGDMDTLERFQLTVTHDMNGRINDAD